MKNRKLTDELNRRFKVAPSPKTAQCPQAFLPIVEISKELKLVEKAWEEVGGINSLEYIQKQVNEYIRKNIYEQLNASKYIEALESQEKTGEC